MADILILGAGLTGLSAAYNLEQLGFFDYEIVEMSDRPGGLLKTFKEREFLFDQTGHFLHISNPSFETFLDKTHGLSNFNILRRQSFVYSKSTYTAYPFQKNLYGLPPEVIAECIERFVQRKKTMKNPETFKDWVLKHFGSGLGKHFFFPYNKKLLCNSLTKIKPSWTGRFVPQTTLTELITGATQKIECDSSGYNGAFLYPKEGGIESIIKSITKKLKSKIECNLKAVSVDPIKKEVQFADGQRKKYKYLITTMPLKKLLQTIDSSSKHEFNVAAEKLECNKVICINLGFNVENISNKHWVYFPEKIILPYRIGFWHNFKGNLTPQGTSGLYAEVSTMKHSITNFHDLEEAGITDILKFYGLSQNQIIAQKTLFLENAYVIYDQWREDNLAKIHRKLESMHIFSIGRFGHWKYSSMQEAFLDGMETAEKVTQLLKIFSCRPKRLD